MMSDLIVIIKKNYSLKSRYVQQSQSPSKQVLFLSHRVMILLPFHVFTHILEPKYSAGITSITVYC